MVGGFQQLLHDCRDPRWRRSHHLTGRDLINIDGSVATNARMASGTPDASKLVELGGGDLVVEAGAMSAEAPTTSSALGRCQRRSRHHDKLRPLALARHLLIQLGGYLNDTPISRPPYFLAGLARYFRTRNILMGTVANTQVLPVCLGNGFWYNRTSLPTRRRRA